MASTFFFITSLLLTITSITAIDTTTKPTTATTTAINFTSTLLLPISTDLIYSLLEFGFFRRSGIDILVSACVVAAYLWGRVHTNLVLGHSSFLIAIPCILKGIFVIQDGIVVQREVLGLIYVPLPNFPFKHVSASRAKGKGKQKIEEDKNKEEDKKGGGGRDKGRDPEDGENEWDEDARVQIRKYWTETDESIGVLIEEVPIDDCPSWTTLANRIHEVWKSIDREEDEIVEENVGPSSCWPGYEVSYWSFEKKRINWNQVEWNHAKQKLALVRLVPILHHFF